MRKHQGMTLIAMLLTMATVVIVGILVMRVVPVYIHHYEVISSLKALNKIPSSEFSADPAANAEVIRTRLIKQFDMNSIYQIKPEQIVIGPSEDGKFNVSVKYQVIVPVVANARLLFDFEANQEVKAGGE